MIAPISRLSRVEPVEPLSPVYTNLFSHPRERKPARPQIEGPVLIQVSGEYGPEGKVLIPKSLGESIDLRL